MKALKEYMNEGLLAGQDSTIKGGANIAKNVIYDEACKAIGEFILKTREVPKILFALSETLPILFISIISKFFNSFKTGAFSLS
jgi:hypothetical protein